MESLKIIGRNITNAYYDFQQVRIASMNRVRDVIRKRVEGIKFDEVEEKKEKKEYKKKYTDKELLIKLNKLLTDGEILTEEFEYIMKCWEIMKDAKKLEKRFQDAMKDFISKEMVYNEFLIKIRGIGDILSANLIKEFRDCSNYDTVSKLWAHCVPKGELILTENGYTNIEEIKKGELVYGKNGKLTKVENTFKRKVDNQLIYNIKAMNILPIKVTSEHPIFIGSISAKKSNTDFEVEFIWKKSMDIKEGDYLIIPKAKVNHLTHIECTREHITPEVSMLFGRFVADGSTTLYKEGKYDRGRTRITFGMHEDEYTKYIPIAESFGSVFIAEEPKENPRVRQMNIGRLKTAEYFKNMFGKNVYTKKIPSEIFNGYNDIVKWFLRGYIEGDGWDNPDEGFSMSTVSQGLALQIQLLSTRLSILPRIHLEKREGIIEIRGKKAHQNDRYHIRVNRKDSERITDKNTRGISRPQRLENKDYFFVPVKNIDTYNYSGYVYNLGTINNTFLLSNVIVHNSGNSVIDGIAPKRKKGEDLSFSPRLRTLTWKLSDSLMKQNKGIYKEIYNKEKEKQLSINYDIGVLEEKYGKPYKKKDIAISRGHAHNRALRKMRKIFLDHYWCASRELNGLPTEKNYVEGVLNHTHIITWREAIEKEGMLIKK